MSSMIPSTVALGLAALAAAALARSRISPETRRPERLRAARILGLATAIQGMHFAEEAATGFHQRFPRLFGLPELPFDLFVAFNVACLAIWLAAVPGLRSGHPLAFFPAWFLAIAGSLNGVAHPLMALSAGGYFPGLVSAPVIGAASAWLGIWLARSTSGKS